MKANIEGLVDPVVAEDLPPDEWTDLRRQHALVMRSMGGRWIFHCVDCEHPMFPKVSILGHRFFAHRPGSPDACALKLTEGESPEHQRRKLAIYHAIKRQRGWEPEIEAKAPTVDPITGRPVIVDVVARRPSVATGTTTRRVPLQGWEVQLSRIDPGQVLDRQEVRQHWLDRCTWVTDSRPAWADQLPWYQVARAGRHGDVVVDGVVRWDKSAGDYIREEPFPADLMVKYILRDALWTQDIGWRFEFATSAPRIRGAGTSASRQSVRSLVANYCDRLERLSPEVNRWSDVDWIRYAKVAHSRLEHGERLTDLDRTAIARCPTLTFADEDLTDAATDGFPPYDPLRDTRPCIACGTLTIVSASVDFPIHHHCAFHIARGDSCPHV